MRFHAAVCLWIACMLCVTAGCGQDSPPPTPKDSTASPPGSDGGPRKPSKPNKPKADRIVAKVNGEPIYDSELAAGRRKDAFGATVDDMKEAKLMRLINSRIIRQFLKAQKVEVLESEIDGDVDWMKKNPPSAGCACCRYPSLEAFMEANGYDMKELRAEIANGLGLQKYTSAQWEKEYPAGEKRDQFLKTERPRIEQDYAKVSQIFFNTFQNPDFQANPDKVRKAAKKKAESAWNRLQKKEAFDVVAKEISDDTMSRAHGGELGCIPMDLFGKTMKDVLVGLKPGEYSKPVESPWGSHVFRREAVTDADVMDVLKADFMGQCREQALKDALQAAKIEEMDTPPSDAPSKTQ